MDECKYHADHTTRISRNEKDIERIYVAVDKIKNRLPNWATLVIGVLTMAIGWLISSKW